MSKFLADDAPYSLERHHEMIGDVKVTTTPWQDGRRKITYSHPINLPGAPSTGDATKTQTITKLGNYMLCVETETWISNVPLADCFFVSDRLTAEKSSSGKTLLTVEFGLTFVKKTMFRGIISATSVRDVKIFHRGFIDTIQTALQKTTFDPPVLTNDICDRDSVIPNTYLQASKKIVDMCRAFPRSWVLLIVLFLGHVYTISYIQLMNYRLDQFEQMMKAATERLIDASFTEL